MDFIGQINNLYIKAFNLLRAATIRISAGAVSVGLSNRKLKISKFRMAGGSQ